MDEQIQQFLMQYAQAKGMDEQQAQQFMQEFAQASPEEQQAFLEQAQQGTQQPQEEAQEMQQGGWSTQGYKRNSPDRFQPVNYIPSNRITMQDVDQPLMLYGDGGDVVYAEPGQEYELPNSQSVMEVPLAQQGRSTWEYQGNDPLRYKDRYKTRVLLNRYEPQHQTISKAETYIPAEEWEDLTVAEQEEWVDLTVPGKKKATAADIKRAKQKFTAKTKTGTGGKFTAKASGKSALATASAPKPYSQFLPTEADAMREQVPLSAADQKTGWDAISQQSWERGLEMEPEVANPTFVPATGKPYQPRGGTSGAGNPFRPDMAQFIPDLLKLADAQSREPGYRPHLDEMPIELQRLNPTAARAQVFGAYRGAAGGLQDAHTQIGRGIQLQQYSNFLNAINSVSAQYDNQNTQIANQQEQYNNQMQRQTAGANLQYNQQAYQQDLGTREAQRQATLEAVGSISTKRATAKQLEKNYNLFKSAYASKYVTNADGTLSYDVNAPDVTFNSSGNGVVTVGNPDSRNKGAGEFTQQELRDAAMLLRGQKKQQGGKARKYTMKRETP